MAGSITPGATGGFTVTPSNSTNFNQKARALYVGGVGDVTVLTNKDSNVTVLFSAVPVGTILPIECWRVNSTGTSATLITALYWPHGRSRHFRVERPA